ncbi:MAG: flagellar basal body P-ring protein FlgI [Verrucomicrobia bacterium]|nr:flagellar basal body P-ring protein FlgI [Verrucomicrobiota bacterium]
MKPRHRLQFAALVLLLLLPRALGASALGSRIKDLATLQGARDNQLIGVGLVTGIAGEGDKNPVYTVQAMANLLQTYGMTVPPATISSKNVAVVTVTATLPPFAKPGSRLDVTVSSLGDAKTLQGGTLLLAPLYAVDRRVYAAAQGPVSVGGFAAGTGGPGGASVQKNHPTTGQIVGGALVERELPAEVVRDGSLVYLLREPDFTTAARLAEAINAQFPDSALARDSTSVWVKLPSGANDYPIDFIARLESLEVTPDTAARIILNERTGTIVATASIKIAACAVSHGNLTISIASTLDVSQPGPLSQLGTTVVTPRTNTSVSENKASLIALPELPTIEKVATALNSLGVTPRDMMAIFQAMKQAGALQAELLMH